ncbi:RasGEF domain family protein [Candida parapsilosis]|uniref:RasGEF domain family protein n=1 Tax=Candida parapsilosis TaxID=5480 RepID=A0A8X7NQY5_CANPA|nr:RasGEF domain family protein [Candida parapsilosis]KAF6049649.1 RasGEF domain family protein [Candida parapsilosis]KAF6057511.1 RasGEF domain family protein [Candida parapsilosis]KAF6065781.1 RasGEF domain family protein [Candida parapsilosis]
MEKEVSVSAQSDDPWVDTSSSSMKRKEEQLGNTSNNIQSTKLRAAHSPKSKEKDKIKESPVSQQKLPEPDVESLETEPNFISKSLSDTGIYQQHMAPEYQYNKHNESIFDDEKLFPCLPTDNSETSLVKFDEQNPELINHATLHALIVQMTSPEVIDYNLISDFFLTYRLFTNSNEIMGLLTTRLIWSLQYINSGTESNTKLGKLVLLRTFVVLRHWIINYFIDDFDNNHQLCDQFSSTLNGIIKESNLICKTNFKSTGDYIYVTKILKELKMHWLSLLNKFWLLGVDINIIMTESTLSTYNIPLTNDLKSSNRLSKSNTEMSIHTNPSYRRSAMLSLYDSKIHHKMLIFDDDSSQEENPQFSINNLLLHHQSSRSSINNKIHEMQKHKRMMRSPIFGSSFEISAKSSPFIAPDLTQTPRTPSSNPHPSRNKKVLAQTTRHNRMEIKDSSLDLKKTKDPNVNSTTPTKSRKTKADPYKEIGFSTNGNVKLPTSKIHSILPPTPVKKMDCKIVKENILQTQTDNSQFLPPAFDGDHHDEFSRKKSIRKLMDGWKRSLSAHSRTSDVEIKPSSALQREQSTSNASVNNLGDLICDAMHVVDERNIGNRVDVLSARIVDELEYLIQYYMDSNSNSIIHEVDGCFIDEDGDRFVDVPEEASRQEVDLQPIEVSNDNDDDDDVDINDLSELNIIKIDNLINEKEDGPVQTIKVQRNISENILDELNISGESFQKAASINWNDDDAVDLNASAERETLLSHDEFDEFCITNGSKAKDDQVYEAANFNFPQSAQSFETSTISTPSNITSYDAEVAELGIAMSPPPVKPKRVSYIEGAHSSLVYNPRISRISRNSIGSGIKRESMASYLSYDSAFSITNDSNSCKGNHTYNTGLRKKTGFNNLRADVEEIENRLGPSINLRSSQMSRQTSKSTRKSIRFSVLRALTELPFNEVDINSEKNNQSRYSSADMANSSIFSVAIRSRRESNRAEHTQNTAVTGSSGGSIVIPGISSYALKELAAIPDESMRSTEDPIEYAFNKLEGKNVPVFTPKRNDEDNDSDFQVEDTEDILRQINDARSEDAIGSTFDISNVTPLTPIRKRTTFKTDSSVNHSTSTPERSIAMDVFDFQQPGKINDLEVMEHPSPKIILDNYSPSSDLLSVRYIMDTNAHISFVLSFDSKSLADHFTVIEKDMLQEVDWKDLIELKWNKKLTPVNSWLEIIVNDDYYMKNKGVNLVIARFNLMVNWIISEILLTQSQVERINIISRFIHIAQHCLTLQNYGTLMQVILALTSQKVQGFKSTWRNLPPGDILTLKTLEELASPLKNFLNVRLSINHATPSKGCIPFVGLYLSDLTFNAERPTFVNKDNITKDAPELINFSKFRTSVHIVKSLSQCIEWSSNYQIEIQPDLLSKCLYIKSLDEEEMNYCISFTYD